LRRKRTGAPFSPPAKAPASPKGARTPSARPAAAVSPMRSIIQATLTGWRRSRLSAEPSSSGSPTPVWGGEPVWMAPARRRQRRPSARSVWVFLASPGFAAKGPIMRVGFPWTSLDSLVRIEIYQWVTRHKASKSFSRHFCPWRSRRRNGSPTILACGAAGLFIGQAYSIFRFSAIDCRLSWRYLWVIRAVMAGLVPATHVVRRVERSQASGKGGSSCIYRPSPSTTPTAAVFWRRCGVDGRDKPRQARP
jgi:hypothetical protein